MTNTFSLTVSEWARRAGHDAILAIFRESVQDVYEIMTTPRAMGGPMPLDTGFLRASVRAAIGEIPMVRSDFVGDKERHYTPNGQVELVIASAELGDVIGIGVTAAYGARVNYGFTGTDVLGRQYNQTGALFVERAAQRWPAIVAANEARLASAIGGS